jgi:hypothetical protein
MVKDRSGTMALTQSRRRLLPPVHAPAPPLRAHLLPDPAGGWRQMLSYLVVRLGAYDPVQLMYWWKNVNIILIVLIIKEEQSSGKPGIYIFLLRKHTT